MRRGVALALALLGTAATPLAGAECTLGKAIYSDPGSGYQLWFEPRGPDVMAGVSNVFEVKVPGLDYSLKGEVIWNNGESRPTGFITHGCENAATEKELESCTYWKGVLYVPDPEEGVLLLPGERDPAPRQLLLPDFGRIIRYGLLSLVTDMDPPPWDLFELAACGE